MAHYAILRFAKYKGPEIGQIEAHNERTKEKYASNPDIDPRRTHLNFHLQDPPGKYRTEAERQIKAAGCRTRKDSVRMVEALVTASPEFFMGRKNAEIRTFFQEAKAFIEQNQAPETTISAVVHLDEKTPHMHLCFVPLTEDQRLSAKDILGNKKKLSQWQDRFWTHMAKKFPELERGESSVDTGRTHIPPKVFKQMIHLNKQKAKLDELLAGITPLNLKKRTAEIGRILDKYIPAVTQMDTTLKKYRMAFTETSAENSELRKENAELFQKLNDTGKTSIMKTLQDAQLRRDYAQATAILDRIPKEVIDAYTRGQHQAEQNLHR